MDFVINRGNQRYYIQSALTIDDPHIMENILYNDLTRRGFDVDVGVVE